MNGPQSKTIPCFQWLRLMAALAVVLLHTAGDRWAAIPHTSGQWLVLTLWDSLVRWPVPVFIMITGALFLPRTTQTGTVLKRYIPRIALAFFFWSGVYALYHLHKGATPMEALRKLLVGGDYHLWYLPYLCGVYLMLPFLQRIVTDRRLENQLLAVSLVVGLVIPWLADLAVALLPQSSQIVRGLENNLNYSFFFDHLALLVLGHWLYTRELKRRQRWGLYLMGLVSILITGPGTVWLSFRTGFQSSLFFDHGAPTNICAAAALFVFAKHHLTRLPRAVDVLARLSFGVYLSHVLLLHLLSDLGYHTLAANPVWTVPVLTVVIFTLASLLTGLLQNIPLLGRFLS